MRGERSKRDLIDCRVPVTRGGGLSFGNGGDIMRVGTGFVAVKPDRGLRRGIRGPGMCGGGVITSVGGLRRVGRGETLTSDTSGDTSGEYKGDAVVLIC